MKRVVSVSLGSRSRDYSVVVELLGQEISIERIGTDGDVQQATRMFVELDGEVDCLGVGGAVLNVDALDRRYSLPPIHRMISGVQKTPVVDGSGFKSIVERRVAQYMESQLGEEIGERKVLIVSAVDRLGLTLSFDEAGYDLCIGDLMFVLGIPMALHSIEALNRMAHIVGPVARHLPMSMLYPTGDREDINTPRFVKHYAWAQVIAGDCNYITHNMPLDMQGKIVVTNTTTARDVALFRERGVRYLVTSTPRLGERSFGTNLMECVLVALSGKGRPLMMQEVDALLDALGWKPNIEQL